MLGWIALLCLVAATALLLALSIIDLRTRLLPNILVLPLALLGIIFHISTKWHYLDPALVLLGGITGYGILFTIRAIANYVYKQDALGLGDVKLLGAAGLWLGPQMVMLALSLGAFAGLVHGTGVALQIAWQEKKPPRFGGLKIPAGPGFAIGIILTAFYMFHDFSPRL
ncbi:MAG: prepilin peptidase [Micavibrio aeruginosavorus]|uniref:Prepilin peptidase n=1 Tax=Micavibrio aeruginosavorus TaxID=349221 RepID=A0A7T5R209_9BACT|nr:MAG: prepilin peptidase [Micavibrio aeruginosavorus]